MKFNINKRLKIIQKWLLPSCCNLCRKYLATNSLCQTCKNSIIKTSPCCSICQIALENTDICGACLSLQPYFDRAFVLGDYGNALETLITGLKFEKQLHYGKTLSDLFIAQLPSWYAEKNFPTLLIPVPLHKKRLKQRGFNQALEIAKPIANTFSIPLDRFNCIRTKATETQMSLSKTKRKQNVANAFKVKATVTAKHIAIIDDVMTTGHTLNALANQLKKQGAQQVDVWCCARTQLFLKI